MSTWSGLTPRQKKSGIANEVKHLSKRAEVVAKTEAREQQRRIKTAGRNARAAAKLAEDLEAAHEELIAAMAASKARR